MLHVDSRLPTGSIGITPGPVNASADEFHLDHSRPRRSRRRIRTAAVDAVPASAAVVLALQNIAARETDPLADVVVTVGTISGGYRNNVIADRVSKFRHVARLRSADPRRRWKAASAASSTSVAAAYGATAEFAGRTRLSAGGKRSSAVARHFARTCANASASHPSRVRADDGRRRFRVFRAAHSRRVQIRLGVRSEPPARCTPATVRSFGSTKTRCRSASRY